MRHLHEYRSRGQGGGGGQRDRLRCHTCTRLPFLADARGALARLTVATGCTRRGKDQRVHGLGLLKGGHGCRGRMSSGVRDGDDGSPRLDALFATLGIYNAWRKLTVFFDGLLTKQIFFKCHVILPEVRVCSEVVGASFSLSGSHGPCRQLAPLINHWSVTPNVPSNASPAASTRRPSPLLYASARPDMGSRAMASHPQPSLAPVNI